MDDNLLVRPSVTVYRVIAGCPGSRTEIKSGLKSYGTNVDLQKDAYG